jgi:hypothetical protein
VSSAHKASHLGEEKVQQPELAAANQRRTASKEVLEI